MGKGTGKRIGITWHQPSGQFKKYIGKQIGRAGKPQPKCFYLGSDQRAAVERAVELTNEWNRLVHDGHRTWPISTCRLPQHLVDASTRGFEINAADATLEDVVKLYVAEQYARVDAEQVSDRHAQACRYRLTWVMNTLGPNRRMTHIGQQELTDLVHRIVKRPASKKRDQHGASMPISIATAVGLIKAAKMLFEWVADHDVIEWSKPKRFRQIFRIKRSKMLTEAELQTRHREVVSGDVKRFNFDDLGRLYLAADGRMQAWILLVLNCGFTQCDLSELRTIEVHLDVPIPFIHRHRTKTGVEARWALWPETVAALRREMADPNPLNRVFLTARKAVLLEGGESGRDAVREAWRLLRAKTGMTDALPFKFLRKTGADEIKSIGGHEVSEMYLSHQEPGLNKAYANRRWPIMWEALAELRRRLTFLDPAWVPAGSACLFTQDGLLTPRVIHAKATKRNKLGVLNVSFHAKKKKYFARVFREGKTYFSRYFDRLEDAAAAAESLRAGIEIARAA